MIKYIIVWLGIFILGSLIVSAILDPSIIDDIKDKISSYDIKITISNDSVKLIPSEMDEYGWNKDDMDSCIALETLGEMNGISSIKRKFCVEACGWRDMGYSYYTCDRDLFICYCDGGSK